MIGFKSLARKTTNLLLALALVSAQLFAPISAIIPKAAAAGQITFGAQFENQTFPDDPNTWTNGQLDNYSEGDYVNFRFQLNATDATAEGTMLIEFDKGTCNFFTNYFDVVSATPAITIVTEGSQTDGSQYFTQLLNVDFSAAGNTTVIFTLQLSNTAGDCIGSNTGVRLGVPDDKNNTPLDENGDFDNVGAKTLPMAAGSVLENPSLTITKSVESGDADPDEFYFTFSPAINGETEIHIPDGQTSVTINEVNPDGEFVITEHGPNGYTFTGGTGTSCVDNDATIGTAEGVMTATVTAHTSSPVNATCNFSNTQQKGSITIIKNAVGGDDTFNFTGNVGVNSLTTSSGTASQTVNNLTPGSYNIAETVPTGWDLTNTTCVSSIQDTESVGSLELDPNETITCTFTNTKRGHLIVQKTTNPAADPTVFSISASSSTGGTVIGGGSGTITDASDHNYEVTPGMYSVTETIPEGWAKTNDTCQNVQVGAGQTAYCTITNTKNANLTIVKDALPDNLVDIFGFTTSGGLTPNTFTLDDNQDATYSNQQVFNVAPGDYTVTETVPGGWKLTDLTCTGTEAFGWPTQTTRLDVTLTAGANVTCTFENTKYGSISGTKYEVNADGSNVFVSGDPVTLADWTINLILNGEFYATTTTNSNGGYSFLDLLPGNYTIQEVQQDGWTQIEPASPGEISETLEAGENSTGNDFGNFENGSISGYKFNDKDGDRSYEPNDGEVKLPDWPFTFYYDEDGNDLFDEPGTQFDTDASGNFSFDNLAPGDYQICEDPQTELGWVRTTPVTSNCRTTTINLSDESVSFIFGNQGHGTITVIKNVDTDGDGQVDDENVDTWTWDIDGAGDFATGSGNSQSVAAGTYDVSEDQQRDFHFVSVSCSGEERLAQDESVNVTVSAGENVVCTFVNARDTGTIEVIKELSPESDDGVFDLQINGTTEKEDAGDGDTTGAVNVVTGTYNVSELAGNETTDLDNYDTTLSCMRNEQSFIQEVATTASDEFTVSKDDVIVCTFTNVRRANLTIIKDAAPNDAQDFHFTISEAEDIILLSLDESTGKNGGLGLLEHDPNEFDLDDDDDATLSDRNTVSLSPGIYTITEDAVDGWDLGDIDCGETSAFRNGNSIDVFVNAGEEITCTFENHKRSTVTVTKYNDYDRDGERDDNEPVLPGWEFTLAGEGEDYQCEGFGCIICIIIPEFCGNSDDYEYSETQATGEDGTTTFEDVKAGVEHELTESLQAGWTLSNMHCEGDGENYIGREVDEDSYYITPNPGENVQCEVGNYRGAYMLLEKTNNRPEPTVVGDTVTYTLTVTVPEDSNPVYGATVTDLPPEGFEYIPGSETATKGSLTSAYASPGIWTLGDLFPGEVVILTYQTRIADSASAGTYPDLAFAEGCDVPVDSELTCAEENAVLANVSAGDDTPFVGTEVTIRAPQVLAANTTVLVNTGTADIWKNMMIGTLLMGAALATLYRREQKGGRA